MDGQLQPDNVRRKGQQVMTGLRVMAVAAGTRIYFDISEVVRKRAPAGCLAASSLGAGVPHVSFGRRRSLCVSMQAWSRMGMPESLRPEA